LQVYLLCSTIFVMDQPTDLETAVTDLLLATGQLLRRLRVISNTRELSWSQAATLARLDLTGPMTTADLARAEAVKPQSMGGTLSVLEEEGLVERQPHASDGRQVLFALTHEGYETRRKVSLAKHEWLKKAIAEFTPKEQKALFSAIELVRRLGES